MTRAKRVNGRGVGWMLLVTLSDGLGCQSSTPASISAPVVATVQVASPAPLASAPPGEPAREAPRTSGASGWSTSWRGVAEWSQVEHSERCWFFSGPIAEALVTPLEGEVRVEQSGDQVRLLFASGATFAGRAEAGRLTLRRHDQREHQGASWTLDEQLDGALQGGQLTAKYDYRECDLSGKEGCPGRCRISARLAVRITTAPP